MVIQGYYSTINSIDQDCFFYSILFYIQLYFIYFRALRLYFKGISGWAEEFNFFEEL